jgi:integrase
LVSLINFHLVPRLASLPVEDFTVEQAQSLTRAIMETPIRKGNQPSGPSIPIDRLDSDQLRRRKKTTNSVLSILRVAFSQAWENGKVSSERPWRCIRRFKNVDTPKVLHLSRPECKRLLENCRPDLRRLVLGALYTGCRITELLRMRCSDVGRDGFGVYVTPLKSHRPRFVFLADEGMAWFLDLVKGRNHDELLFINDKTGRPFSRFKHLFSQAVRDAGLPFGFSFHGLRHTYASQLVQAGAPIMVVSEQLGHVHALTVLKTYGHLTPQIRESEVRQRFTTVSDQNLKRARRRRKQLNDWRESLHGGKWNTYAQISDLISCRN